MLLEDTYLKGCILGVISGNNNNNKGQGEFSVVKIWKITQRVLVCGGTLFEGRVAAQGWPPCSVGGLTGLFGSCLVQKNRGWGRVWAATRPTGRDRTSKKLEWL